MLIRALTSPPSSALCVLRALGGRPRGTAPDFSLYFAANSLDTSDRVDAGQGFGVWRASAIDGGETLTDASTGTNFTTRRGVDFVLQATWSGGSFDSSSDQVAESTSEKALYIDPDAVEQLDGIWRVHAGVFDRDTQQVTEMAVFFGDPADACKPWAEAWSGGAQAAAPPADRAVLLRRLPPGTLTPAEIRRATGYEAHEVIGTVILGSPGRPEVPPPPGVRGSRARPRGGSCLACDEGHG